jgi:GntR family transcriptional regulator, transcriptional repressor for pyruvate dehydrogenase complex
LSEAAMNRHLQPVRLPLPSEEVARRLADAVRAGFFRVGAKLPSERSLSEQMQVSRPTVREALKLLAAAGILTARPGAAGGSFVTSEIVPLDFMAAPPLHRLGDFDEAIEMRRLILPWVAQIAGRYAEDVDFERMREALRFGLEQLPPEGVEAVTPEQVNSTIIATMRFDLSLAQATRNGLAMHLMEQLLHWVEPMRQTTLQDRSDLDLSLQLVETMMRAIEAGNPERIAEITERRLGILEKALEERTGRRLRRNRHTPA